MEIGLVGDSAEQLLWPPSSSFKNISIPSLLRFLMECYSLPSVKQAETKQKNSNEMKARHNNNNSNNNEEEPRRNGAIQNLIERRKGRGGDGKFRIGKFQETNHLLFSLSFFLNKPIQSISL